MPPTGKKKKAAKKTAKKTAKKKAKKAAQKPRPVAKQAAKKARSVAKKARPTPKKAGKKPAPVVPATPAGRLFDRITDRLRRTQRGVTPGPMMSSPGLRLNGKVFAFFYNDQMVFRLGKEFDPGAAGLRDWKPLNPFKNKPPLPGWYVIAYSEQARWNDLADRALAVMAGK